MSIPRLFMLLLAFTLILSACNPKQATPPIIDTNLVTEAPVANYNGDDETVYFLIEEPDGTQTRFEAGFIKDGKLTLNPEDPPAELQRPWIDTLPANAGDLEYSDGAETAMTVHVTALLIGDTGLMITGTSGLTPSSGVPAEMTGLTWTDSHFQASWYLPARPDLPGGMHLDAAYDSWVAYGATGPNQSTTMDPANFYFDITHYISHDATTPGLPHPFHYPTQPDPEVPETPGDEDPDEPGNDNPEDPETPDAPGDEDPGEPGDDNPEDPETPDTPGDEDPDEPGDDNPEDPETPGEPEAPEPAEVKAVISSPVNGTAFVDEPVTFSAAGSTGEGELSYAWSFVAGDDPIITTESSITHSYPYPGTFTITLTVTDTDDQTAVATTSITISEPEPTPVTHQVLNYDGPDANVTIALYVEDEMYQHPSGVISSTGLITPNLIPVPHEYLTPINDETMPAGSYDTPGAHLFMAAGSFTFMTDATPPALIIATNRNDYLTNPTISTGDALGFYAYADQDVNIHITPESADYFTADLQLTAGWNFVSLSFTDDLRHLANADPEDYYWFDVDLDLEPEPQVQPMTLNLTEWTGRPGAKRVLTAYAHYDNDNIIRIENGVTWTSSDEDIATIVFTGEGEPAVQAESYGTTTITAEWEGFTASLTVTVDTVIVDNAPPHNVSVLARYPIGNLSTLSEPTHLGELTNEGHFTFASIDGFQLTPITNTPVVNSAYADDPDANLVFVEIITTSNEASSLWIGDPLNDDRTLILGNTSGSLWYADRPVSITHTGPNTEHTYDVHLKAGWNLVTRTTKQTLSEGGVAFHFESAPMNALPWMYQEPR